MLLDTFDSGKELEAQDYEPISADIMRPDVRLLALHESLLERRERHTDGVFARCHRLVAFAAFACGYMNFFQIQSLNHPTFVCWYWGQDYPFSIDYIPFSAD